MNNKWITLKNINSNLELGKVCKFETFNILFGNKNLTEQNINEVYPNIEILKIKQTHSSTVLKASKAIQEADAHFSFSSNVALQIKTADCIPLFLFDPTKNLIMAVHAGWRGVVGKIAEKAVLTMLEMGSLPINLRVVIGPHIRMKSFEVDQPVLVNLLDSIPDNYHHCASHFFKKIKNDFNGNDKYCVDLEGIVKTQLRNRGIREECIDQLSHDTKAEDQWHSYRRDKESAGRNISLIMRIDSTANIMGSLR